MGKPLVSIIIPTFNAEPYLRGAIDSALAQTYGNCEIIVIDDGSTDATKEAVRPYVASGRIKYVFQQNAGLSGARNRGIREAQGNYIALLDADDFFLPEKMERQVDYLESHPDCDISYCDLYHFREDRSERLLKLQYRYYSGDEVLPHLVRKNFIAPLAVVLRKSVFDRFGYFDEALRRSEDLEFWIRVAGKGGKICFLPEILGKLRMRVSGNLQDTKSQSVMKTINLDILDRVANEMSEDEKRKYKLGYYRAVCAYKASAAYFLNCDRANARLFAKRALYYYPFSFPFFLLLVGSSVLFPCGFFSFIFKLYRRARHLFVFRKAAS